ncbi:MAG: hypothetical protein ABI587_04130 [Gemmatimonadales bacterium]
MLPWLQRLLGRRDRAPLPVVTADATGFTLTVRFRTRGVAWGSIRKISGYKLDLTTHTQIVLLVEVVALRHGVIALSDNCPGFATLFGPMEAELGIDPRPYLEAIAAAPEPRPVVLYLRPQDWTDIPSAVE